MQRIFIFLLSVIFTYTLSAQNYNFKNFKVEDGLSQSDILAINQTKKGFLLLGTNGGGLNIYNGYSFKSITKRQGLADNVVFSIATDKQQNIWCATNAGISKLNSSLSKVTKNYQSETPFYVCYAQEDKTYFGSAKGLYFYDIELDSIIKKNFGAVVLDKAWISSIFIDSLQNTWIGTQQNGLFKIDNENKVSQFYQGNSEIKTNYIKTIIEGKNNKIYIGTLNGLYLIQNETLKKIEKTTSEALGFTFTSSALHDNKIVFGALNNKLFLVNLDNDSVSRIISKNGFDYKKVWCVFNDNENNLWLGTIGTGLVKLIDNFKYYNKKSGLENNYITAVFSNKNKVYVANRKALQIIKNKKITETFPYNIYEQFNYTYHISNIKDNIYVGTNKGLFKLSEEKYSSVPMSLDIGNTSEDIYTSFQSQGNSYFGGKNGLYQLLNDTLRRVEKTPEVSIYNITEYKKHLYIASDNGIYKLDSKGNQFISDSSGLNCSRARSLVIDSNLLWIGTNNGIYIFNGNKIIYHINTQEKLSSDNVYFLIKDKNNNIWAGTNKGVDKIFIPSVYEVLKDSTKQIEVNNYNKNKGFNSIECNMNSGEVFNDKEMLFGTINGLYVYDKSLDVKNEQPPRLSLNNIKLNFIDVDWSKYGEATQNLPKNLSLSYQNNNLIFEYVGISLSNPEEVAYQYKLDGLNNKWLPVTKDRKAVYTAIPPGQYTFELRARNADKVWTKVPLTFSFTITPPWWQTTWFYISAIAAIFLTFYLIMVYRTRMLKREQQILSQKVDERTKELRKEKEKVEKANTELASQKEIIEIANKNITDSINYAQKIQEAILPKVTNFKKVAYDFSILYLPKDVVSGDFYWFENIDNKLVFAAADCTGHGVPGALMSMIGINSLNQIVIEQKQTQADIVLQEMNNAIKKALNQDDLNSKSRDGLDIVLICVDFKTNSLTYAGAFRPLVYVRNNKIHEIKGSRRSIGGETPLDFNYDLHQLTIQKGDVFYLYSDGYPDQFGGDKGKKLMSKRLKSKFLEIHQKSSSEQKELLLNGFNSWKGSNDQIDDILVAILKF